MAIHKDFPASPFEQPDRHWYYERRTRSFQKKQDPRPEEIYSRKYQWRKIAGLTLATDFTDYTVF
jgi:hypothetical protein